MSMPKLNAPAEIHWRRSNMNTLDPILMKSVEVLKDCRSLNAAAEMNCPMPRSVEKVPIRNEKRCMPPCIDHMELLAWMQRAGFSEDIQCFKLHGNPLNSPHLHAPNTKFAPTGHRRAPNIISHHYTFLQCESAYEQLDSA